MKISKATIEDCQDIFNWRNDPVTLSMFKTAEKVSIETHTQWFKNALKDKNRYLFVGFEQGMKIGVCRFDLDSASELAEVSINLNPDAREKKLSYDFLLKSIREFQKFLEVPIKATIKKNNIASIKCFTKCGFILTGSDDLYNFYIFSDAEQ